MSFPLLPFKIYKVSYSNLKRNQIVRILWRLPSLIKSLRARRLQNALLLTALSALVSLLRSHMLALQRINGLRWQTRGGSLRFRSTTRAISTYWASKTSLAWRRRGKLSAISPEHFLSSKFFKSRRARDSKVFSECCKPFLSMIQALATFKG